VIGIVRKKFVNYLTICQYQTLEDIRKDKRRQPTYLQPNGLSNHELFV